MLIIGHRGQPEDKRRVARLLDEPGRIFLTSPFLHLETAPKADYYRNTVEQEFYRGYFESPLTEWCRDLDAMLRLAQAEARRSGLGAMDALHIAAAHLLHADDFITTERPGSALYRTGLVPIIYLYSLS